MERVLGDPNADCEDGLADKVEDESEADGAVARPEADEEGEVQRDLVVVADPLDAAAVVLRRADEEFDE